MLIIDYIINKVGEWIQKSNEAFSELGIEIYMAREGDEDRNITSYVVFLFLILLFI